jgi:hypothetical protein
MWALVAFVLLMAIAAEDALARPARRTATPEGRACWEEAWQKFPAARIPGKVPNSIFDTNGDPRNAYWRECMKRQQ